MGSDTPGNIGALAGSAISFFAMYIFCKGLYVGQGISPGLDRYYTQETNKDWPKTGNVQFLHNLPLSRQFYVAHTDKRFKIDTVEELSYSANEDIDLIANGYTHLLKGRELCKTTSGQNGLVSFEFYIEADGGWGQYDRTSEKIYKDTLVVTDIFMEPE